MPLPGTKTLRRRQPVSGRARMKGVLLGLFIALVLLAPDADARPPQERLALLRRGVNITAWFRYPASQDPAALTGYLGAGAITGLRTAGFTFVRLPVDPVLLANPAVPPVLAGAIRRLRDAGLGVVVSVHPAAWRLESQESDRAALHQAWTRLTPLLARLGPERVFAEVLNEPVFPGDPAAWQRLQRTVLAGIRSRLPNHTVILTGHDWSSIAGLVALTPVDDPNVVYTFHLYEPADLTSLAAWRSGLDRAVLARLPFPVGDRAVCEHVAGATTDAATAGMIRYYCAVGWNESHMATRIQAAAAWGRRHDVALLAGEFGASIALNTAARMNWLRAVRVACETEGIGWALWGYDDMMGFGVSRPAGASPVLDPIMLRALGLGGARD